VKIEDALNRLLRRLEINDQVKARIKELKLQNNKFATEQKKYPGTEGLNKREILRVKILCNIDAIDFLQEILKK